MLLLLQIQQTDETCQTSDTISVVLVSLQKTNSIKSSVFPSVRISQCYWHSAPHQPSYSTTSSVSGGMVTNCERSIYPATQVNSARTSLHGKK